MLGVPPALIAEHGAVSEAVARAMAEGALRNSHANVSISITGVAGPGGGSVLKPVGLVHFACAKKGSQTQHIERRFGDLGREMVRIRSVLTALDLLRKVVEERDQ
jgi:nicotinamide-nucleotide amidase